MLAPSFHYKQHEIAIVKAIATEKKGINELYEKIIAHQQLNNPNNKKNYLLAEKAFHLIQQKRMKDVSKTILQQQIQLIENFNLYKFIEQY